MRADNALNSADPVGVGAQSDLFGATAPAVASPRLPSRTGDPVSEQAARCLTERDAWGCAWLCAPLFTCVVVPGGNARLRGMAPESQPDREIAPAGLRTVLDRLIRDGTATARTGGSVRHVFPVAVGPAEGAAIRSWVIREHAARTVEVGLGYGISALFACEGLLAAGGPGTRHVVIDSHQDTRFAGVGL